MILAQKVTFLICINLFLWSGLLGQQRITDDFEGNGTITSWAGDDCGINTSRMNPFPKGINTSATVLEYNDSGGQYANIRFDVPNNFDLSINHTFSLKIYVPSSSITGSQRNQVSLKLQDGSIAQPWTSQCEIMKTIIPDRWQLVQFDFKNDNYICLGSPSVTPTLRTDFNRVLIQLNGENNNDKVIGYIDDVDYDGTVKGLPVFGKLIWSDEFIGAGRIDTNLWHHQTQIPVGTSWFNGEIQHYTNRNRNSKLDSGFLKLTARKEQFTDQGVTKNYTSARLNSKFAFTYGKVEIKAKLPSGIGTWPAFWLLGKNIDEDGAYWDNQGFGTTPWPACGEIDIMEHWGNNQNFVQSAMHTPSSHGNTVNKGGQIVTTASSDFHIYTLEWTPVEMVFRVDGIRHYTYNPAVKDPGTWPFDKDQYIILNTAILPNIDPSFTSSTMYIDYLRVYEYPMVNKSEEISISQIKLYPNPVDDHLRLVLPQRIQSKARIQIYSSNGALIRSNTYDIDGKEIFLNDLSALPDGLYLLSLQTGYKTYSTRFTIQ